MLRLLYVHYTSTMHPFHLRLVKVFTTHKPNMVWKCNLHQSTSLTKSRKTRKAHACKSWVPNLSIVPHTLGILTTNITYSIIFFEHANESQVNTHIAIGSRIGTNSTEDELFLPHSPGQTPPSKQAISSEPHTQNQLHLLAALTTAFPFQTNVPDTSKH